ncbi:MAG: transglycosylase domain-containing protein [Arenimonas sp.]
MDRALKYALVTLLSVVLIVLAFVYGLYFAGARHIPAGWGPTTAAYPDAARLALWRSVRGSGEPGIETISVAGYAWRFVQAMNGHEPHRDADLLLLTQVARNAYFDAQRGGRATRHSNADRHLTTVAMSIQASRWGTERVLDTALDRASMGQGTRGFRAASLRVYGQPIERLDAARLQVLVALSQGPGYYDPWCHPDRLRERMHASWARTPDSPTAADLDAAVDAIVPAPVGHACR